MKNQEQTRYFPTYDQSSHDIYSILQANAMKMTLLKRVPPGYDVTRFKVNRKVNNADSRE
jgi:hypothetical protein